MASIEQTKDVLEVQREQAAQMTEKALSTIDAVVAFNSMTLTVLAITIGVIGIFGAAAIVVGARSVARKLASARMDAYIKTDEGKAFVQQAVRDEVRSQLQDKFVVVVQPDAATPSTVSFPQPPAGSGGAS